MAGRGSSPSSRRPTGRRDGRSTPRTSSRPSVAPVSVGASGSGTRFTARALILLGVAVMLIASYTASVHAWWQQRSEIAALESQNRRTEAEIDDLKDQQRRWNDPAYIRQQARERFGWVMPGEVGYRVIGVDGELKGQSSTLDAPEAAPRRPWVERLWGSVEAAGQAPQQAAPETPSDPALEPDE
ncbi:septum formation initiator family protein [Aeromicrobium sp. 636]|uniref:Septum formation initiator family protein n=1 Tax=Aeromicrobium senzhongii TaxID=2663859 RepID=A0A8I0ETM4_9ACTN|nr:MULTISPECIES: septum formation initiator family protein [Aeromicrobium]MBC9225975.1 septum formation initiator family protein [Aeromicrobium senzhongii]MCQ3998082.1 septum formation initiator family protein [Aeromicrobium sp. 636]